MYLTEKEIFGQYNSLIKTYEYFIDKSEVIKDFWKKREMESIIFTGCGSSYCICRSAHISAMMRLGKSSLSIPSGDLLINFNHYEDIIKRSMLISPSRSGSTSEIIKVVKKAKNEYNIPCISISAKEDSDLGQLADLNLVIPWAFDESVCQTQTVTNLFMACLLLIGIISNDKGLLEEIKCATFAGNTYIEEYKGVLKEIAVTGTWKNVVILGDSEISGISMEGALAFMEICRVPSHFYNVLDVRHGPMVTIDDKTLVIASLSPEDKLYQKSLIQDLKDKGALIVTVSTEKENYWGSDYNITLPMYKNYAVAGIPYIFVPQAISFYKSMQMGINPDRPEGLDSWIKL